MRYRVAFVRSSADLETIDRLDAGSALVVLGDAALEAFDRARIDRLVARRSMIVAAASKDLRGLPLAAALLSDSFVLSESATLEVGGGAWGDRIAAAFWRIGHRARRLLMRERLSAAEALAIGLCDGLVPRGEDPLLWVESWLGKRSALALQVAAALVRRDGGDRVERAEFARLFSTGAPGRGLRSFLDKEAVDFSGDAILERR